MTDNFNHSNDEIVISTSGSSVSNESAVLGYSSKPISTNKNISSTISAEDIQVNVSPDGLPSISSLKKKSVTERARKFIEKIPNQSQQNQGIEILDKIDDVIFENIYYEFPEIVTSVADDGTIGLTWNIDQVTLGIAISVEPSESSWFLLAGENLKSFNSFGNLSKFNIESLMGVLIYLLEKLSKVEQ